MRRSSGGDSDLELQKQVDEFARTLIPLGQAGPRQTAAGARVMIEAARGLFRALLRRARYEDKKITALLTKFHDAGRRSAPWKQTSSRVPGRPQDGADGNRIIRWKLPPDHKFYADETTATLVEVKYILQTLSMRGAPEAPSALSPAFEWLVGHPITPGVFKDPIRKTDIPFEDFLNEPRIVTSGHINPLDRGGKHEPGNTSLILKQSNDLQGNNTIDELLDLILDILRRHGRV